MLAPGRPENPIQLIDVRDLAEWIIKMAEARTTGIFNATGPPSTLTFQSMLEQCATAAASQPRFTWLPDEFLLDHKLVPFKDLPYWLPDGARGFFAINCRRAFAAGSRLPLASIDTARDTLDWDRAMSAPLKLWVNFGTRTGIAEGLERREVEIINFFEARPGRHLVICDLRGWCHFFYCLPYLGNPSLVTGRRWDIWCLALLWRLALGIWTRKCLIINYFNYNSWHINCSFLAYEIEESISCLLLLASAICALAADLGPVPYPTTPAAAPKVTDTNAPTGPPKELWP